MTLFIDYFESAIELFDQVKDQTAAWLLLMDLSHKEQHNLRSILQLSRMIWQLFGYDQPYVYRNATYADNGT
jgi:hypothetical protein